MICPYKKIITVPEVTSMSSCLVPRVDVESVECSSSCKHYVPAKGYYDWVYKSYEILLPAYCEISGDLL